MLYRSITNIYIARVSSLPAKTDKGLTQQQMSFNTLTTIRRKNKDAKEFNMLCLWVSLQE